MPSVYAKRLKNLIITKFTTCYRVSLRVKCKIIYLEHIYKFIYNNIIITLFLSKKYIWIKNISF